MNTNIIVESAKKNNELGLFRGKIGEIIYYFYSSTPILSHKDAKEILNNIYQNINTSLPLTLKDGLLGIGIAINILMYKSYIKGNVDHILKDIDEYIYKLYERSLYEKFKDTKKDQIKIQHEILLYYSIRLKYGLRNKNDRSIYENLVIDTFNYIYMNKKDSYFNEPIPYSIDNYLLVDFLISLSILFNQNICKKRIYLLLREVGSQVFSRIPILQANRIFLLYAIHLINIEIHDKEWENYESYLKNSISINKLLTDEIKNRQILFSDGLGSCYLFLSLYNISTNNNMPIDQKLFLDKFKKSKMWNDFDNIHFLNKYIGLDGFFGLKLLIEYADSKLNKHEI